MCHLSICPVKDSVGDVTMIILDFDDPTKRFEDEEMAKLNVTTKCKKQRNKESDSNNNNILFSLLL